MGKLNLTTRAQCKTKQNSTLQSLKKKSSFGQGWRLPIEVYGMETSPLKSMGKLNLTTRAQCKTKQNSTLQSLKKKSSFGQGWRLPIEAYGMEPSPLKSMGKNSKKDSSDSICPILKLTTESRSD